MACRRREPAGNERQSQVKVDSLSAVSYRHGLRKAGDNHTHANAHSAGKTSRVAEREIWPNKMLQMNELSSAAAPKSFGMQNRFELTQVARLVQ